MVSPPEKFYDAFHQSQNLSGPSLATNIDFHHQYSAITLS
ncbi:hypothetical protein RV16_GL000611 [Enterococcus saccharolyticus]|nr:hypothetical protein RV16_GL000611 [Enterococcus saccharolyticus]